MTPTSASSLSESRSRARLRARFARLGLPRCAIPGLGEVHVAEPTAPAAGDDRRFAVGVEVRHQLVALGVIDLRPDRHRVIDQVLSPPRPVALLALTVLTGLGVPAWLEPKLQQRV